MWALLLLCACRAQGGLCSPSRSPARGRLGIHSVPGRASPHGGRMSHRLPFTLTHRGIRAGLCSPPGSFLALGRVPPPAPHLSCCSVPIASPTALLSHSLDLLTGTRSPTNIIFDTGPPDLIQSGGGPHACSPWQWGLLLRRGPALTPPRVAISNFQSLPRPACLLPTILTSASTVTSPSLAATLPRPS